MNNLEGNSKWKSGVDEDGQRLSPPLNGTGHAWDHPPKRLFNIIRYGFKKMDPNYKDKMLGNQSLKNADIWSILKSTWPENIRTKYDSHFN